MSLWESLNPLLSTGPTQEERKTPDVTEKLYYGTSIIYKNKQIGSAVAQW